MQRIKGLGSICVIYWSTDIEIYCVITFCCRIGYSIPMFTGFVIMFISTISKQTIIDYYTAYCLRTYSGVNMITGSNLWPGFIQK